MKTENTLSERTEKLFFKVSANLIAKKMTAPTSVQASYTSLTQKQKIELAERTETLKVAKQAEINQAIAAQKYDLLAGLMDELNALNVVVTEKVAVNVDTITGVDYLMTAKAIFAKYSVEQLLVLFGEHWTEGSDAEKLASLFLGSKINCKPAPVKIAETEEEKEEAEE